MSTTMYFEEKLYPPNDKGRADILEDPVTLEINSTNYFGDDQIFIKIASECGQDKSLHLSKKQAQQLSEALESARSYIGYDNT